MTILPGPFWRMIIKKGENGEGKIRKKMRQVGYKNSQAWMSMNRQTVRRLLLSLSLAIRLSRMRGYTSHVKYIQAFAGLPRQKMPWERELDWSKREEKEKKKASIVIKSYLRFTAFLDCMQKICSESFHLWKADPGNNVFADYHGGDELLGVLHNGHAVKRTHTHRRHV